MERAAKRASRIILTGLGGLRKEDENFEGFVNEGARIILREWLYAIKEAVEEVLMADCQRS